MVRKNQRLAEKLFFDEYYAQWKQKRKQQVAKNNAERRERALIKLATNLKIIENLNDPNEGGDDPLKLLPEEVWETIFAYLVDAKDLISVWRVCTLFRSILQIRRLSRILLPLALQVKHFRSRTITQSQEAQLRLLSKTWRSKDNRFTQ